MSIDTFAGMRCSEIFPGKTPKEINFQPLGHKAFLVAFESDGMERDPITLIAMPLRSDESEQPQVMGVRLLMGASRFATVRRPFFPDHQLNKIIAEETKANTGELRRDIGRLRFQERNSSRPKFEFYEPAFREGMQLDLVPVLYREDGILICGFEYGGVYRDNKGLGAIVRIYSYNPAILSDIHHCRNLLEARDTWIENQANLTSQPARTQTPQSMVL